MPPITPNLWFDDNAVEAAEFYASIFPNSVVIPGLAGPGDTPITVDFELDGKRFTGINGGPHFIFNEAMSLMVECEDQAEIDYYWHALLAEGGTESQCGWLKDRFGVSWQIASPRLVELLGSSDPERARRAFEAMMKMVKIDLAVIEAAAEGASDE